MPKRSNETLSKYKKRVIDSKSDSFCGAKWGNATIWLGHGQTTSCHHPPSHQIDIEEIKFNPSAIHNTKHKKAMRALMQEGDKPTECDYCWKIEGMDKGAISDRVYKTIIYQDEQLDEWFTQDSNKDVMLKTLEVAFDRTCNFACSYCNPHFSTTWAKDIKKEGGYKNILSDGRGHFIDDAPNADPFPKGMSNPYIEAFWKWWPELSQHLEEIRITGGEPLMSIDVWKLFKWFEDNPDSEMRFAVNSNLIAKEALIDRLIEKSHFVKNLHVYTSCEAYSKQAEYIRDGLDYFQWLNNIDRLILDGNIKQIHMMMTINGLCLFSIVEFLDNMLKIKRRHGGRHVNCSFNILRFPSFQSPLVLPEEIRFSKANELKEWVDEIKRVKEISNVDGRLLFSEWEISQTERLIDYLLTVDVPHANTATQDKLEHDFKTFYSQYDNRRGKSLHDVFPKELTEWVDSIKLLDTPEPYTAPRRPVIMVNGKEIVKDKPEESIDDWFDRIMKDE